jgi:hypothetical protein
MFLKQKENISEHELIISFSDILKACPNFIMKKNYDLSLSILCMLFPLHRRFLAFLENALKSRSEKRA